MLTLQSISKDFGELTAVDDVSVEIESGELVTLVGPSGSGKSTVLNMIAGHLEPSAGSIMINGTDVTPLSPQNRPTSMVFQSWALFPHMTVRENIEFPIEANGEDVDGRVEELLRQVQLDPSEYAEKNADELSGGEQQRVALARAIAYDPEILLLDEPLGSLDYVLQQELRRELSDLNEELDMTFVYVTHSLESALIISDRIFVLDQSRLVQAGTPREIYQEPKNRFIAEFMGDANVFPIDATLQSGEAVQRADADVDDLVIADGREEEASYLIVRYDRATVAPDLERDMGVEGTVFKKLMKGNTVLVEVVGEETEEQYFAEVDYAEAERLDRGDSVYVQWNEADTVAVPE
ncbi:ABC transporter ATP-binding protein [Haloplanus salilacus]|uniref:ABC transporter ATP-binding protein n=1 Tax=Haloplanus salilacus TaxID=2949994 RepID=UPI0030CF98B5